MYSIIRYLTGLFLITYSIEFIIMVEKVYFNNEIIMLGLGVLLIDEHRSEK